MSDNESNIKNSLYRFNFSLAKISESEKSRAFIALPKGIIRYLEIDDNLANMGYVGAVVFNNFYGILDKLGLGSGISDNTTLFDINIENLDFNQTNLDSNSIQTLVLLQNNTDPSNNSIDKSTIYSFEEYPVNLLKQKKFEPSKVSGKITESMFAILSKCFFGESIISKESFDELAGSSNEMSIDKSILKTNSYYDFLKVLYKYLLLTGKNNSPGLLQLENFIDESADKKRVVRKFTITPLFDKIRSLIDKLNKGERNLEDEVLEQFTIGGESDEPSFRENIIESLTVLRPDFKTLYENKWLNYTGVTTLQNLTDTISINLRYDVLKKDFERDALNNKLSNLPIRIDVRPDTPLEKVLAFDYPVAFSGNLLVEGITSMVYKSFIYDNTAVIFKTLGNPYRKPGSFIRLNGGNESDNNSSVTGYWYIIGVKHIFENEIYTNEITAVKIFIENKSGPVAADTSPTVNPSTSSSVTPPARTNTSNFGDPNGTNPTNPAQSQNDIQLPTSSDNDSDYEGPTLLPPISTGEPAVDTTTDTQPATTPVTPLPNNNTLNDDQLPTPTEEGYDGPSDSLFLNTDVTIPEGIPFSE